METTQTDVDRLLQDNPELAKTVREIERLMSEHQRLVAEGKAPAVWLMGIDSTSHNSHYQNQT